jgi:hypothetical protein
VEASPNLKDHNMIARGCLPAVFGVSPAVFEARRVGVRRQQDAARPNNEQGKNVSEKSILQRVRSKSHPVLALGVPGKKLALRFQVWYVWDGSPQGSITGDRPEPVTGWSTVAQVLPPSLESCLRTENNPRRAMVRTLLDERGEARRRPRRCRWRERETWRRRWRRWLRCSTTTTGAAVPAVRLCV